MILIDVVQVMSSCGLSYRKTREDKFSQTPEDLILEPPIHQLIESFQDQIIESISRSILHVDTKKVIQQQVHRANVAKAIERVSLTRLFVINFIKICCYIFSHKLMRILI